ncbi:5-formyltetrahydrofolate cyclo-ligase [Devosia pacifica]|uniref:5-formyltetrahydrofolate cyclo-ligase n=1 Tax=Devosia pacifica TaxID=1335967 RepID=A0A918SEP5_9HYPH|nr:5-formyltetrahydrofolate cyclo-ligase [Devosia pacifica]GHA38014.1 5-formyltetrahydrofolate cyclo-ligase [Devosia pacifica]
MLDDTIEQAKQALRNKARDQRAALSEDTRAQASRKICDRFFEAFAPTSGQIVAAYWRIRDEVDCEPILVRLMDSGQPVCLPVVMGDDRPLDLRIWEPGTPLYPAGFGTLAPEALAPRAEPDIILVPLLGFDDTGTRLGYGGGFYDRTLTILSKRPLLIGLAYACQKLETVPRAPHDVPLDAVVTEDGVTRFSEAP